jgi:hypothetical protein
MCSLLCARSMFRPDFYWWRLVLTLRKLCEVIIALLLSSKPLFQAWCALDSPARPQLVLRGGRSGLLHRTLPPLKSFL